MWPGSTAQRGRTGRSTRQAVARPPFRRPIPCARVAPGVGEAEPAPTSTRPSRVPGPDTSSPGSPDGAAANPTEGACGPSARGEELPCGPPITAASPPAPRDPNLPPAPVGPGDRARPRLRAFLARPIVWQSAGLTLLALSILGVGLLRFDSYVTFGNLELPYTVGQYRALLSPPGVWTPFQYFGFPTPAPFVDLVNYGTEVVPLALLAIAIGPVAAAKVFLVVSTVFLGIAFLLFVRTFVRSPAGQFLAAAFLLAGPFQLALYGQGDFQQFVSQGFIFLGLAALARAADRPADRWLFFPLALWLLVLSLWSLQLFLLGVALYLVFGAVYLGRHRPRATWRRAAATFYARFGMLPILLAPLLVTVLFGALNLGATSPQALPLSTYVQYSAAPWRVFFLFGYFNLNFNMVAQVSTGLAVGWSAAVVALLVLIWVGGIATRDRRVLLCFGLVLLASFFGAGASGPIGPLNVWLYLHVPGIQALNASYYWDWMVVAPLYALAAGALWETLRARTTAPTVPLRGPLRRAVGVLRRRYPRPRLQRYYRYTTFALVGAVVVVAAIPYGSFAPYGGSAGMHAIDYPADYATIPPLLEQLVGHGYAGVALFNPDVNWFLFNSTHPVQNVFFLYPSVRTVGISTYGSYPTQSNTFAYWLYQQFYSNSTRYIGELFATIGVEYLLVLNGTQSSSAGSGTFLNFSYGQSANRLMADQVGIVPAYSSADFVLYRNLFYGGVAASADHLSLVAGDYGELNAIAYAGVNLTAQAFLYPTDLTPSTCPDELPLVDRVYAPNANALLGIGLRCDALASADPLLAASPSAQPSAAWTSSTRVQGVPSVVDAWPGPLAVSDGGEHVLSLSVRAAGCGATGCRLWLPVRFGAEGGVLSFSWAGATATYQTGQGYAGANNSMVWIELPFALGDGSGTLRISASSGWNAVGSVLVEGPALSSPSSVLSAVRAALPDADFFEAAPGVTVDRVDPGSYAPSGGQGGYYASSSSGYDPAGSALLLRDLVPSPIVLPLSLAGAPAPGWLSLLVLGGVPVRFEVSIGDQNLTLGSVAPGPPAPTNWTWDRIYLNGSSAPLGQPWSLTLESGTLYLAEVAFVPAADSPGSAPIVPGPALSLVQTTPANGATNVSVRILPTASASTIAVSGQFPPAPPLAPYATFALSGPVPAADQIVVTTNAPPGLLFAVNGTLIGGTTAPDGVLLPSPFRTGGAGTAPLEVTVSVLSDGAPSAARAENLSISIGVSNAVATVPFGDLAPTPSPTVRADSAGYTVTDPGASGLLWVRVAYYPGLTPTGGAALDPALGSLTTLLWNPGRATSVFVTTRDAAAYAISIPAIVAATGLWIVVELAVVRRSASRRGPSPPAGPRSADGPRTPARVGPASGELSQTP